MNQILTVSQINGYLKGLLDEDVQLKSIYIRGEVGNFTHHLKTGHFYFTLKDARTSIKAVMFKWNAAQLRFMPRNGMSVIIFGSVQLFERDGICQIICADMQPDGMGALYMAYEQLKEKLQREGLFDTSHKKPLPALPQKIAVVTAKTGAALQDIINILSRRYPIGELMLFPALVQGEQAAESICAALRAAEAARPDVIIVGRGGGSMEDLWCFNDERVARAVYACRVPVISAVGHEVDYTICDFVADLRAPTPSAAAELCAPDIGGLRQELSDLRQTLRRALSDRIRVEAAALNSLQSRLKVSSPAHLLEQKEQRLTLLTGRLRAAMAGRLAGAEGELQTVEHKLSAASPAHRLDGWEGQLRSLRERSRKAVEYQLLAKQNALGRAAASLEALSPLRVLARGYTLTSKNGRAVSDPSALRRGDLLETRFVGGTVQSTVTDIHLLTTDPQPDRS